ncbi:sensor histidine kinase [Glycomyces salinus]|uniref:sensor histidine kinase n=1 Tax=Glycomyces salinus TaxID=980294 RepID=UPI0018EB5D6E|nr:histidine kinase [Glycomyces salinus]
MSRMAAQLLGGVFATLACLAPAVPVVVMHSRGEWTTAIPVGWWLACYAVFFVALVVAMWLAEIVSHRLRSAAFAVQVVAAPVLVLTAPGFGWTAILLVFNAALSAALVRARVAAALIAANTAVVAASALPSSSALEIAMGSMLYLVLQAAAYLGLLAMLREGESRLRLSEANVRLRAAAALLAESSRAQERLRIARELHDLIGHQLTVLALELEVASHQAEGEAAESVGRARAVTRSLLADVRGTVGEMRGGDRRLGEALESVVADLPEPSVHLRVDEAAVVDEARTAALIRCSQEVITNAIRHSHAANLWIEVAAEGDALVFEARDDGVGAAEVVLGNGLRGIAERVEALGGTVDFRGRDGFRVRAEVPAG